jgi:uridine kinase
MSKRPLVIGIAGPSCSGKTSLARHLAERLRSGCLVFELDWYYHDQAGRTLDDIDVDVPSAIDHELLIAHLGRLIDGHAIERPVYDYATHSRAGEGVTIQPAANIIVEGLFALYWPGLYDLYDRAVFILADHDTCLERRIARDTSERGRTVDQVTKQFHQKVRPMYDVHVHPTCAEADLVLSGEDSLESMTMKVLELVLGKAP